MPQEISRERLTDLLVDPREDLDFEVKNWLDLQHNNDDKATFAKAALALANHGGGFITLGFLEAEAGIVEPADRPATLDGYSQDLINGIIQNYCDPPFHCAMHLVPNPAGLIFPIVIIPGGHRVPVRARRAAPNGQTVQNNAIYIRKSGPRSEAPQSAQEWDELLARCLRNRRDEMFDQIRDLITGAVPQVDLPAEPEPLDDWIRTCHERWRVLIQSLPANVGSRLPFGFYNFAYELVGEPRQIPPAQLPQILRDSVVRHTGWPPFWYPTRQGIEPYSIGGTVECWLGGDLRTPPAERDAAHSDFWRISPDGLAFLLRGYEEDGVDARRPGREPVEPGTVFDLTLPIWRLGETLLQAERLAANLFEGSTTIRFVAKYEGLAGRSLVSRHVLWEEQKARQASIVLKTHVDAQAISPNLPEIVHPLLSPLYILFNFFELPMQLVVDELARMRSGNF